MTSCLPPFAGLVAFDAVLRHGSVTLAAAELGLTQSAVSHRLRGLEAHFGTRLLDRLNPGLRATEAGQRLARELGPLLGQLGGLYARIAGEAGVRPFRIGVAGALLSWWLSPRLSALASAFPMLSIEVTSWDGSTGPNPAETNLALLWLPRAAQTRDGCELAFPAEQVFPVAAPSLRRALPEADWSTLPLIAKGRAGDETGPEWSWATWLGAEAKRTPALRFRDIGGALQAAADGNGVALARSLLVTDALRRRRLIRLVRRSELRPCLKIQVARWSDPYDTIAAQVASWLVAAAAGVSRQGTQGVQ